MRLVWLALTLVCACIGSAEAARVQAVQVYTDDQLLDLIKETSI